MFGFSIFGMCYKDKYNTEKPKSPEKLLQIIINTLGTSRLSRETLKCLQLTKRLRISQINMNDCVTT